MQTDWFTECQKLEDALKRKKIEIERLKHGKKGVFVSREKFKEWTEKEKNADETNFNWHAEKLRASMFEDAGKILQSKLDATKNVLTICREVIKDIPSNPACVALEEIDNLLKGVEKEPKGEWVKYSDHLVEVEKLREIYNHYFITPRSGDDRFCAECGLYIADPIHKGGE